MKKYIYLVMAVLSLGFASCSQELLPEEQLPANVEKKLVTLTVQAGTPTRLGIQEDENAVHFTWEEGDVLHVVSGTDSYTDFVLTEGAGTSRGIFTAEAGFTEGQNLQIVYSKNPDHPFQLDENGNVQIDLSGQTGQLDERYQYMYGTAKYSTEEALTATLQHLVYAIKLNLSLPSDFTGNIQQFRFFDKSYNYKSNATLMLNPTQDYADHDIKAGDLAYRNYYDSEGGYHQPYSDEDIVLNNLTAQNGQVTAYLYLMATKMILSNEDNTIDWMTADYSIFPCFTLVDEAGSQFTSIPVKDKWTENGDMYTISTNCIKLIDFANEDQADGSVESPYEIATTDQFYSLMLRTSNQLYDKNEKYYLNSHYILTSSIELDDRYPWAPIVLHEGSFDGQGYMISGHQTMAVSLSRSAIFDDIRNSTIKDLYMDADLTFETTSYYYLAAGLVAYAYNNSVIENCHIFSSLSANAQYIGGIIGQAEHTSIIACSCNGNLSFNDSSSDYGPYTGIGGIVGLIYNSVLKGCHTNPGFSILVSNVSNFCHLGGLVGASLDWGDPNQIIGCWTLPRSQTMNTQDYFMGAFLGRIENQDLVYTTNCYLPENQSHVGYGNFIGYEVDYFSGKTPTAEQIASMNAAISDTGYQYNEYGTITKVSGN